ncbi:hypothetical protein NC651_032903 [Populus alba x Populus x berolinensis]|nr:hypothetical protein NC651_032903 [Populus alba x Populus x berolinensis]
MTTKAATAAAMRIQSLGRKRSKVVVTELLGSTPHRSTTMDTTSIAPLKRQYLTRSKAVAIPCKELQRQSRALAGLVVLSSWHVVNCCVSTTLVLGYKVWSTFGDCVCLLSLVPVGSLLAAGWVTFRSAVGLVGLHGLYACVLWLFFLLLLALLSFCIASLLASVVACFQPGGSR